MRHIIDKKRWQYANHLIKWMVSQRRERVLIFKMCMALYRVLVINNNFETPYKDEKHHYIQKFILENFRTTNPGLIYQYEKGCRVPALKSIKREAACISGYYNVSNVKTKKRSLMLEKEHYSFIERWGKMVIEDFILKARHVEVRLTDFNLSRLAEYFSTQYVRTPAFKAQLKNYLLFLIENRGVARDVFSNSKKSELIKAILDNKYNISRQELVEFNVLAVYSGRKVEDVLRGELDNLSSVLNLLCPIIGNFISESIFRKKMFVLSANEPYFFILPDSGAMLYDFSEKDYFLWPYGWDASKSKVSLFFPVSPTRCVVYTQLDLSDLDIQNDFIQLAVGLAYHQKQKYIFSDRLDLFVQKNIDSFPLTNGYSEF